MEVGMEVWKSQKSMGVVLAGLQVCRLGTTTEHHKNHSVGHERTRGARTSGTYTLAKTLCTECSALAHARVSSQAIYNPILGAKAL